jgi:hypothetical protein
METAILKQVLRAPKTKTTEASKDQMPVQLSLLPVFEKKTKLLQ